MFSNRRYLIVPYKINNETNLIGLKDKDKGLQKLEIKQNLTHDLNLSFSYERSCELTEFSLQSYLNWLPGIINFPALIYAISCEIYL